MQIRIARTREDQEPGERDCGICRNVFWLGEATAWAITDDNTLIGEVCPACLEGGASHIEAKLEERARLSRVIAEQDDRLRERRGCSQCGRTTRGGDLLRGAGMSVFYRVLRVLGGS